MHLMKKILLLSAIMPIIISTWPALPVTGQTVPESIATPVITSEEYIPLGKKALFDASDSDITSSDIDPTYLWEFSDTAIKQFGKEVVHEFVSTGIHKVTLTIQLGETEASVETEVFVFDKQILMITDQDTAVTFNLIKNQAANQGVRLKIISSVAEETGFLTEEKLVPLISEESEFIKEADALIFYTEGSVGLQAFARYWQNLETDKRIDLMPKLLVNITDQNISIAAKLAQQSYQVMRPKNIILTRPEALNPTFEIKDYNQLTTTLGSRAIEFRIIDARSEKSKAFFLSHTITNLIAKGIPTNTIFLLLAFPFIAFIITFARQVIGIAAFGIYTPLVISLSMFIMGIYFGLGTVIIVIIVSYLLRTILNRFKLLYIPKTGIILSAIGLSFLGVIWFLSNYQLSLAVSMAIFPMLVISTLSEKFLSAQAEEGLSTALLGVFKTVIVALAAYCLVVWTAFTNLIMSWPELIILPFLGLILLGKFTGLRLNEYIRFRSLFKEKDIEE